MTRGVQYLSAAILIAAVSGSSIAAQTGVPAVRGTVKDQTGAVMPGVHVELMDGGGATVGDTRTDHDGTFTFATISPGTYQIRATFEGFKPTTIRVRVAAGRTVSQTVTLDLASISQEVTVGRDRAGVTTGAADNRDAIVVDEPVLRNLPIFDRDVVGTLSRFLDPASVGSSGVTLVVDGMEARKVGVAPSAIQQVKINQDPYSAEYPRPGRGRIEVVTKAGSEAYHGSLDWTFRDAHLNARDAFAETRPPEQRRIYEGFLGGPIRGGKNTSFLFTVDRREEDLQSIVYAFTPDGLLQAIVPRPTRGTELSGSVNHQQGKHHVFSLRFTGEQGSSRNQGVGGTTLAEAGSHDTSDEEQIIFGHRWVLSGRLLNEVRLLVGHEMQSTTGERPGARIVVLDAFTGGGAQSDQRQTEHHFTLAETLTYSRGRHLLKGGVAIPDWSRRGFDDRSNRDGTFTFSSLSDYALGRTLSFAQQRGDGALVFLQKVFGAFVQDQIALTPELAVGIGLRYDWQNIFSDNNNFAPRASFAYAAGKKTVVRGGAGVFYDRAGEGALREVLRSREQRLIRYLILQPAFPDPFATAAGDRVPAPSIVQLDPAVSIPYVLQYGAGVERQLRKGTTLAVNYLGARGADMFRSRDINAPPPPLYSERPNPAYASIRQIESTGRQQTHSIQFTLRGRMAPRLQGSAQYTVGSARNDTSGINALPANNYDLTREWGRADFDQRHRVDVLGQYKGGDWFNFGVALALYSGRPYSLRTGTDDYHTGQTNARSPGVARNTLHGPGYANVDVRWSREFRISGEGDEGPAVSIAVDAFNVLNRVNFVSYIGNRSSPFFGRAIAAQPPRRVQLSVGARF